MVNWGHFHEKKLKKKSHNTENKLKGRNFGIFQHPFCRKTPKKLEGGPFGGKKNRKVAQCRKKLKEEPFSLARKYMVRSKKEKPFWFCSLGQQVKLKIL